MPPRAKAAPAAAAAAATATPVPDAAVVSGKRKRTTVAEVDAAAQAKSAAAEASKPKRARAESASKPKAAAAAAASGAAPRDRYPDKSVPALLGCAPALRAFCLSYPASYEDFPWKHRVFKVGPAGSGKIFAYLHGEAGVNVSLGLKLPSSGAALVQHNACAQEMGYGMGKHGWVGVTLREDLGPNGDRGPVSLAQAKQWIDESYRAVANKTNIKQIEVDLH